MLVHSISCLFGANHPFDFFIASTRYIRPGQGFMNLQNRSLSTSEQFDCGLKDTAGAGYEARPTKCPVKH